MAATKLDPGRQNDALERARELEAEARELSDRAQSLFVKALNLRKRWSLPSREEDSGG